MRAAIPRITSLLIASCVLVSCRTVSIDSALPILIPSGLTAQDVKLAIMSAVYPEKAPRELAPVEKMTDNALKAVFGFAYTKVNQSRHWFVEDIKASSVFVGFDDGEHYFRVEYQITGDRIVQRIDASRNLRQSAGEIHKAVFVWLGEMESRIRQRMGEISVMKAVGPK